jgi:hypothetical protein
VIGEHCAFAEALGIDLGSLPRLRLPGEGGELDLGCVELGLGFGGGVLGGLEFILTRLEGRAGVGELLVQAADFAGGGT